MLGRAGRNACSRTNRRESKKRLRSRLFPVKTYPPTCPEIWSIRIVEGLGANQGLLGAPLVAAITSKTVSNQPPNKFRFPNY